MQKNTKIRQSQEDRIFDTVVYLLGSITLVLVVYPLIYAVSASVSDPMVISRGELWLLPKGIQFDAYREVFKSSDILLGYKNTIFYSIVGTVISVFMTIIAAYPLSRPDIAGRNVLTFLITFTMFFSGGMIPTYLAIQSYKMLDTFWVMVIPGAINVTNMIIVRNHFQYAVPNEIVEAAYVDGCSNLKTLWKIVLPISKSIVAVIVIFYFVGNWNAYFDALIYLSQKQRYPLQIFLRQLLLKNQLGDISGQAASSDAAELQMIYESLKYAVIIVSSLPVLIIYPLMQKHFVKGIMMGSLKG